VGYLSARKPQPRLTRGTKEILLERGREGGGGGERVTGKWSKFGKMEGRR